MASKYGAWIGGVIAAVLMIAAMSSIARRAALVRRLERQLATATVAYAEIHATYEALNTQVALATEGADLDGALRDEMGMAKPGDEVIVPVPVGTPAPTPLPPLPPPTPEPPPWEVWWQLFFGAVDY